MEEMGPSLDLVLRRTHLASDDLYKLSMKMPKALKVYNLELGTIFICIFYFNPFSFQKEFVAYYIKRQGQARCGGSRL